MQNNGICKVKLSDDMVREIADIIDAGMNMKEVCEIYRISMSTARRIKKREGRYGKILAQDVQDVQDVQKTEKLEEITINFNGLKPINKIKVEHNLDEQNYIIVGLYKVEDSDDSYTEKLKFDKPIKLIDQKTTPIKINNENYIISTVIGEIEEIEN